MFNIKCRYKNTCQYYRKDSKACKRIEICPDKYTCGVYRQFSENKPGNDGGI